MIHHTDNFEQRQILSKKLSTHILIVDRKGKSEPECSNCLEMGNKNDKTLISTLWGKMGQKN